MPTRSRLLIRCGLLLALLGMNSARGQTAGREKEAAPPRTDRYGDPLPAGAVARLGTVRLRHGTTIEAVAFAPDGKAVVSGGWEGAYLWDVATGKKLQRFPQLGVECLAFSPDGKTLALGGRSKEELSLWDVASGRRVVVCKEPHSLVLALAFSPDGRTLATGGHDQTIRLWDPAGGREVRRWKVDVDLIHSLAFSPDGKTLAGTGTGQDSVIRLWDVDTGRELRRCVTGAYTAHPVLFSPDGKTLISGGNDGTVALWEVRTGKFLRNLGQHKDAVWALALSPDGKTLAAGGREGDLRLWDLTTGKGRRVAEASGWTIHDLAFSPDGKRVASACGGGTVRLWDVATGKEHLPFGGHVRLLTAMVFSPDGKHLFTGGNDGTVRQWEAETGREVRKFPGVEGRVGSLALSRAGDQLAAGTWRPTDFFRFLGRAPVRDYPALVWDLPSGKGPRRFKAHPVRHGGIGRVAFAPDDKTLLTRGIDYTAVRLWDLATGKERRRLEGFAPALFPVAVSPDGRWLAAWSPEEVLGLWDLRVGKLVRELQDHPGASLLLAFSPDGRSLITSGQDERPCLWEVASGKMRCRFGGDLITDRVAFSPDGHTLAAAPSRGPISFWDVGTGRPVGQRGEAHLGGGVLALAFSPQGTRLASGHANGTALVWDVAAIVNRARPHTPPLTEDQLESRWADLASADAEKAYRAIHALASRPGESVRLLGKKLRPAEAVDPKRISRLVAALDSETFAVREDAVRELEALGERAEPALRRTLRGGPSLEKACRIEGLLGKLEAGKLTAEQLREVRAVEVLEYAGTPEARRLLGKLAGGAEGARLTREAKLALARLHRPHLGE